MDISERTWPRLNIFPSDFLKNNWFNPQLSIYQATERMDTGKEPKTNNEETGYFKCRLFLEILTLGRLLTRLY